MTEEDAKTKLCCGPKIVADMLLSQMLMDKTPPQPNPNTANALCVGSVCMAWRWTTPPYPEGLSGRQDSVDMNLTIVERREPHAGDGRCGLAGKP